MAPYNVKVGTFFIGIPVPLLPLGTKLGLMDMLLSDAESCDYANSSYPHVTLVSPRPFGTGYFLAEVKELLLSVEAGLLTLERSTFFAPNRIVSCIDALWVRELHQQLLAIPGMPQGDPTWEGATYNPHLSLAKVATPLDEAGMLELEQTLGFPYVWKPSHIDVFIKPPNTRHFVEYDSFPFRF